MGLRSQSKDSDEGSLLARISFGYATEDITPRRNLRNAHFYAVVFAAFANDISVPEMQDAEREILLNIARTLSIGESEARHVFSNVHELVKAGQYIPMLEECMAQFDITREFRVFLVNFESVYKLGKGAKVKELKDWHDDFVKWLPENTRNQYLKVKEECDAAAKAKAAAARKHRQACAKAGMTKRFQRILDDIEMQYGGFSKTTPSRISEIGKLLTEIDPDVVDLGDQLLSIYNRIARRGSKMNRYEKDRADICRVIAMLVLKHTAKYVNSHSYSPSPDQLLNRCYGTDLLDYLVKFCENYFSEEIEFEG